MYDIVNITLNQKIDLTDAQRLGGTIFRKGLDRYFYGIVGPGAWYRGCKCTDKGTGQLNIGNGEIYLEGVSYYNNTTGGEVLDLLASAPTINFLWVAIVGSPQPQLVDVRPTTYLTDSASRATTGRDSPRLDQRWCKFAPILGQASADPKYPDSSAIPAGNVILAYVKLSPTGIVQIVQNDSTYLLSLATAKQRLNDIDVWRAGIGATLDVLASNIAAIQDKIANVPTMNFVLGMARDLASVKSQLRVPQQYVSYGSDHYLDQTYSDILNVDYLATIQEGIRFPPANQSDSQLGLYNIYDGNFTTIAYMLHPMFDNVKSTSNNSHDETVISNQYQYQTLQTVQLSMTRQRIRVGPWYTACSNTFWWQKGGGSYNALTGIFTLFSGETYEIYPDDRYAMVGVTSVATSTHLPIRMRQVWIDQIQVPYTDTIVTRNTVQGALHGNTFLCPQDGWMPQLNLYFSDRAVSGDVTLLLLQVPSNGQPDLTKIIGKATVAVADIKISTPAAKVPTPFVFAPLVAMQKGQRYAFIVVTQGAHSLWRSTGNKLPDGSYFVSTDGSWTQPDLVKDLCFDLIFARFRTAQVEAQLNSLNLNGGIVTMDVLAQMYVPAGCSLTFQVQVNGKWVDITSFVGDTSPLNAQPPLLPFKAVFSGSRDNMPALGVNYNSRVSIARPRSNFLHISDAKTLASGVTTQTISMQCRLEYWRGASFHTHTCRLRYGTGYTTIKNPTGFTDVPAPDDPVNSIIRTYIFSFSGSPINTFKIEQGGTTTNVVTTYHVAEGIFVAQ